MYYVFQLAHPETHEAYGIFTGYDIRKRINDLTGDSSHPIYYWLRALKARELEPEVTTLEEVASKEEAVQAKKDWIQRRKPFLNGHKRNLPPHILKDLEEWKRIYQPPSYLAYEQEAELRTEQEVRLLIMTLGLTEQEARAYQDYISNVPHLDEIIQTICFTEEILKHTPRFSEAEIARLVLMMYGFYEKA